MNYYTVLYLFIFIIYFFKNDIFSNIINFNKKYNVPNLLNNISTIFKNYEKINYKYLVLIILSIYVFLNLKSNLKIFVLLLSFLIIMNYNKINFILNQIKCVYKDKFLINKFVFFK